MNETKRHNIIIGTLKEQPFSTVKDLALLLNASPATIRRDIVKLHDAGKVRKVFGGIAATEEQVSKDRLSARPFSESRMMAVDAKKAIAAEAEKLCQDGDRVIINGGSTCYLFALRLMERSLSIYTNSMPIISALGDKSICKLVIAGGDLHREPGILFSPQPDPTPFYASKFFVSAQGIGPNGIMESHPMLLQAITRLLSLSDELVVLADSRKFTVSARHTVFPLSRISILITDDKISDTDAQMLEAEGVQIIIAPPLQP